jgi:hypothetical protein
VTDTIEHRGGECQSAIEVPVTNFVGNDTISWGWPSAPSFPPERDYRVLASAAHRNCSFEMFRIREIIISIPLDSELIQRVESLAKVAGRSNTNQTDYLLEKGLQVLEQRLILTDRSNGDYVALQVSSLL